MALMGILTDDCFFQVVVVIAAIPREIRKRRNGVSGGVILGWCVALGNVHPTVSLLVQLKLVSFKLYVSGIKERNKKRCQWWSSFTTLCSSIISSIPYHISIVPLWKLTLSSRHLSNQKNWSWVLDNPQVSPSQNKAYPDAHIGVWIFPPSGNSEWREVCKEEKSYINTSFLSVHLCHVTSIICVLCNMCTVHVFLVDVPFNT